MAAWRNLPVVTFRPSRFASEGERVEWLLWPAVAWRVIGPRARERRLNLVQRAVLGLLVAGLRTADEIAERLCLHRELVALVIVELASVHALDATHRPTAAAERMLRDDDDDDDERVVARVFADPWEGEVWPRFIERDLPLAVVETGESGWPVVATGTHGAPRRDRPFVVDMPTRIATRRPSAAEILRASRLHARHLRDGDDLDDAGDPPTRLDRASCLDAPCEHVFLMVRVRVGSSGWVADDPFGVGESERMRRMIERRIEQDRATRKGSPLLQRLAPQVDAARAESLAELQGLARFEVERRLPAIHRGDAGLVERVVAMKRAHLEATRADGPRDKQEDVVVKAQQAVEHLLCALVERARGRDVLAVVTRDEEANAALYVAVARDCGFAGPLPKSLLGVRAGKVRSAYESRTGSLRPLLLAALLAARTRPDHALRRAATASPALLADLDELACARDPAAHGGGSKRQKVDLDRVLAVAFDAIEQLLPR